MTVFFSSDSCGISDLQQYTVGFVQFERSFFFCALRGFEEPSKNNTAADLKHPT